MVQKKIAILKHVLSSYTRYIDLITKDIYKVLDLKPPVHNPRCLEANIRK